MASEDKKEKGKFYLAYSPTDKGDLDFILKAIDTLNEHSFFPEHADVKVFAGTHLDTIHRTTFVEVIPIEVPLPDVSFSNKNGDDITVFIQKDHYKLNIGERYYHIRKNPLFD